MSNRNRQKGFTILIAVITASILLIIAMSIGGIALKEQVLSTASKESQIAFYAADTGMECALYLDQNPRNGNVGLFGPNVDGNPLSVTLPTGTCSGNPLKDMQFTSFSTNSSGGTSPAKYRYSFMVSSIPVGGNTPATCAVVTITKDTNDSARAIPSRTYTDIFSYGYSTCNASLTRLERGIEAHYP